MSKEFLNNLSIEEIKFRLSKGEKIFNETDETTYAKYVDGLGICKFQRKTDRLVTVNLTLTLFYHLYFENDDYKDMIGCVGWFWDDIESSCVIGILRKHRDETDFPFWDGYSSYKNFRPAKKSELKFWEENK